MSAHHIGFYLSVIAKERPRSGREIHPGSSDEGSTMSEISTASEAGRYEIRLKGHLDNRWASWFDGLTLTTCSDGTTVIHGIVVDQSALHGLLQKVRDVGLPLISVTRVDPDPYNAATHSSIHTRRTT
jgi:hypothetical protein